MELLGAKTFVDFEDPGCLALVTFFPPNPAQCPEVGQSHETTARPRHENPDRGERRIERHHPTEGPRGSNRWVAGPRAQATAQENHVTRPGADRREGCGWSQGPRSTCEPRDTAPLANRGLVTPTCPGPRDPAPLANRGLVALTCRGPRESTLSLPR